MLTGFRAVFVVVVQLVLEGPVDRAPQVEGHHEDGHHARDAQHAVRWGQRHAAR